MQDVYSLEEIKQGQEALQLLEKMSIQIQPINVKLNKQVMKWTTLVHNIISVEEIHGN